jgi:hypothetical protein
MMSALALSLRAPRAPAPSRPPLDVGHPAALRLLATRTLGLLSTEALLHEFDVTKTELTRFVKRPTVRRAIVAETSRMVLSGELARLKANTVLADAVAELAKIAADPNAAAGAKVSAITAISKIASANGEQPEPGAPVNGPLFSLALNLGGGDAPVTIETAATAPDEDDG